MSRADHGKRIAIVAAIVMAAVAGAWMPGARDDATKDGGGTIVTRDFAASPTAMPSPGTSAAPVPGDDIVREAQRQVADRVGRARIAVPREAVVRDADRRIVCGTVELHDAGRAPDTKRYVSFGGAEIAVVDDGSPDFAEIRASLCGSS